MQFLLYLIIYPLLLLVSILPFRLLYLLSDFVYVVVYYMLGYRKKVVRENLKLALPLLSEEKRLKIERESYRHMCDMFLEMIKSLSISMSQIEKRFVYKNMDSYINLEKQGKSIALLCAHYASYEWSMSLNSQITFESYAIYKKIKNKYFDRLVHTIRSRFKSHLVSSKEIIPLIEEHNKSGIKGLYGFVSDQSPRLRPSSYLGFFMGYKVPVHTGAEMLAKRFDMNVVFLKIKKIKRGYYEAEIELLSDNVATIPNYEITEMFLKKVEQQILEAPEYYLWTHRRFKHIAK